MSERPGTKIALSLFLRTYELRRQEKHILYFSCLWLNLNQCGDWTVFADNKRQESFKNDTPEGLVGQSYFHDKALRKLSRLGFFIK